MPLIKTSTKTANRQQRTNLNFVRKFYSLFFTPLIVLTILSVTSAIYGLGAAYQRFVEALPSSDNAPGIGRDGWIQNGASIVFPGLGDTGNIVTIQSSNWRPPGAGVSKLKIKTCSNGETIDYSVDLGTLLSIPLSSSCSPKSLHFEVLNPYTPSEYGGSDDTRALGPHFEALKVTSRIGVPIVPTPLIVKVSGALLLLSVLVFLMPIGSLFVSALIPIAAYPIIASALIFNLQQPFCLWFTLSLLAFGMVIGGVFTRTKSHSKGSIHQESSSFKVSPQGIPWIALIVAGFALILRLYGISFGIPVNYHPDEVPKINAISSMIARNSWDPNYFLHPSLLLYCTRFVHSVLTYLEIPLDLRSSLLLSGRIVSAVAGAGSVLLVFFIGRRLYDKTTGNIAAIALAVFPLHVTCSRYLKEDSLLCFWILASLFTMIKAVKDDRSAWLILSGIFAGLSASTKYSGFLTAGVLVLAPFLRTRSLSPHPRFVVASMIGLILVPVFFVLGSPYILLNFSKFYSDFNFERRHMLKGHTQAIDAWSQYWMYHMSHSVIPGLTLPSTIIALVATGFILWRRRPEDLLIAGAILLFYLPAEWVKAKPAPQPERYIFPCLPFLAIAGGELLKTLARSRALLLSAPLILIFTLYPLGRSLLLARDIPDDTRLQVARWFKENVPQGTAVWLDWSPYTVTLKPEEYKVDYILREGLPTKLMPSSLRESGKQYLVLSSLFYDRYFVDPNGSQLAKARLRTAFSELPIVKEFRAPTGTYGFHNPRLTVFSLDPERMASLKLELERKSKGELQKTSNEEQTFFHWWG